MVLQCNEGAGATDATPQTAQWLVLDLAAEETKVTEIQIAHNIESASETVTDYDLAQTETTAEGIVVKDASGNGYDSV